MAKILNYTTKIDADKTATEIAKILSSNGAQAVLTEYDEKEGTVTALSFRITLNGQSISFRLPCDWKPIYRILTEGKESKWGYGERRKHLESEARLQAVRTAWRIVKDWVEAQMALVQAQMVTTAEVFLPYAVMRDNRTLAQHVQTNPAFLPGEGGSAPSNDQKDV